jgi:hypothetical protein
MYLQPPPPPPNDFYGKPSEDECDIPFTPCWCETRPNNPKCKEIDAVPLESGYFSLLILVMIYLVISKLKIWKY